MSCPGDSSSVPAQIERALDGLLAQFARDDDESRQARAQYELVRSRVHEDHAMWEPWSAAFVEWFLLERAGADEIPPVVRALRQESLAGEGEAVPLLRALASSHRSLFEVERMKRGSVLLRDVIGGASFSVAEARALHGVEVGDLAELRLIGLADQVWFGRTFLFHPKEARAAIVEQCRALLALGKSRLEVIDVIASLRVRLDQFRHVAPAKVYELGGKLASP
jgi:hypothetical protein